MSENLNRFTQFDSDCVSGSGGYGSVWKAKYRGKVVAEKVWKREDVEEEKLRKSFETELSIQM
jgi:serine/threonine protein kinase